MRQRLKHRGRGQLPRDVDLVSVVVHQVGAVQAFHDGGLDGKNEVKFDNNRGANVQQLWEPSKA